MYIFACALFCVVPCSYAMLQDEVRGLTTKPRIITLHAPAGSYVPQLMHAVQNNLVISQLTTQSTQYIRTFDPKTGKKTYCARYLSDNSAWDPFFAKKSFYELIAIHKLTDKSPEQILSSCNLAQKYKP